MSGVAGADRVKSRQDYQSFLASYKNIISKFPGFVSIQPSGSYNSNLEKNDFGDIDLITHIKSSKNKKEVKQDLVHFFEKMPDTVITAFTSEKHAGRRSYNSGEIVTVRYHDHALGYSAQIDNIIALDHIEAGFKQEFLDMPAEKQGLVLGLVKIAAIETEPKVLFKKLNIHVPAHVQPNQEFEFNLSSTELQLRKVTYEPGTFKQTEREILWHSQKWSDLQALLYQYDLSNDFDTLLAQSKQTIHNPRSNNRMQGVFSSMISVKSGEVGTAKGAGKEAARAKVAQTFGESRSRLLNELVKPALRKIVFAFGRFNPPTIGHEVLINAVKNAAAQQHADYVIYVSKTQDHKANPLSIDQKMHYLKLMFPGTNFVACDEQVRTPIEAAKHLNGKYSDLVMIAGADRAPSFDKLLQQYNGQEYNYNTISVDSAGDRDPDSDDASGMSATKMRSAAVENNFEAFRQGLPNTLDDKDAQELMQAVRAGLVKPARKSKVATPEESFDGGSPAAQKIGAGGASYVSMKAKEFESIKNETMLPTKTFAGSKKNKLGAAGQLKGSTKRPAKAGDLVGEHIVKVKGGYELKSHTGKNLGKYPTKGGAEKREKQVNYFKHAGENIETEDQRLDPKCWKGYKKSGTKMKGGTRVNNCVKIGEGWENQISSLIEQLKKK